MDEGKTAARDEDPARDARSADGRQGYYFYGVIRTRNWPGNRFSGDDELTTVRHRDLEAIVREVPFRLPSIDQAHIREHQRTLESALQRGTVLPAPYGILFRNRRTLVRFLEDQYLALDEAISFIEGHWELRIHITPAHPGPPEPELGDEAMHIYSELRQFARAAIPFPREGKRLLGAAFLVERKSWIEFVERSDDLGKLHPDLALDVTGPWPAYDFVKMVG